MQTGLSAQQLYAWFFIGWHGVKGWVMRALHPEHSGLERFQEHYIVEGLPPVPAAARARFHEFMRCTACGACEPVCPLTPKTDATEWQGPMALVISMSRAAPHYADCAKALAHLDRCGDCRRCETVCPEHIPVRTVGAMMREALRNIETHRPPRPAPTPATHARPGPG